MRFFPEEAYKRFFVILLYGLIGGALLYITLRYLFSAFLPFFIALGVAVLLRHPTAAIAQKAKLPKKFVAVLLALLFVSLLLSGAGYAIWRLAEELGSLAHAVMTGENTLLSDLQMMLSRLSELFSRFPFANGENSDTIRNALTETILDMAKNAVAELGTRLPALAASLASIIPQMLVFFVVTVLSAVYICADYDKIAAFLRKNIRGKARTILNTLRKVAGQTFSKVLRSYAILFLFTFAEVLLGFVILREPYAFLLALLTALVDSLPIFGTGTVLLPMALYRFFTGDIRIAIGLCILYGAVTVIRQILEPKILGDGFGMHPLLMLVAMYTGLRLFGVIGMIVLPIIAMLTKNIIFSLPHPEKETRHEA